MYGIVHHGIGRCRGVPWLFHSVVSTFACPSICMQSHYPCHTSFFAPFSLSERGKGDKKTFYAVVRRGIKKEEIGSSAKVDEQPTRI